MPRVSVIMGVHNGAGCVAEAVDSILAQTFTDFEFIIVDDASVDDTAAILERYAALDERVHVLTNDTNLGLTRSLNLALRYATGEFVARQDADDVAEPERFREQIMQFDARPAVAVVGTRYALIDGSGEPVTGFRTFFDRDVAGALRRGLNPLAHPTVMMRRAALVEVGGYDESFRYAQDFELWLRMLVHDYEFYNIPVILQRLRRYTVEQAEGGRAPAIHAQQRVPLLRCAVRIQWRYLRHFWRSPGYWYTLITRALKTLIPDRVTNAVKQQLSGTRH